MISTLFKRWLRVPAGLTNEPSRIAWLEKTLRNIPDGLTILDAGAGEGQFKPFCSHLTYISQDFGEYTGEGAVGLQTGKWDTTGIDIVSDIVSIPLSDGSVDAIMCTEVLEHIPDPPAAIEEFARLIRPGGHLIITAPFTSLTHFAPFHFASGLSRFFYEHYLPIHGFDIEELALNGNYFEFLAQENRRISSVAQRYASTRLSIFDKIIIYLNIRILNRLSSRDTGSSESLCFGVHVLARKR